MTKNRPSAGIRVLGISAIVFAVIMLCAYFFPPKSNSMRDILEIIFAILFLVSGIGVLRLLRWARIGMISAAIFYAVDTFIPFSKVYHVTANLEIGPLIIIAIGLFFFCFTIVFFTRRKIREEFKQQ